jgi:hypothetical protein
MDCKISELYISNLFNRLKCFYHPSTHKILLAQENVNSYFCKLLDDSLKANISFSITLTKHTNMKLKIIGFCIALTLLVACGNDKKETPEKKDNGSASTETYVPPVGNAAPEQNAPNNVADAQNLGANQQQPIAMPSKKLTDAEIKTLSNVLAGLQELNVTAQQRMIAEVQKQGLDVNKFMQIQTAMRNPSAPKNFTDAEKKKFDLAVVQLGKVQTEMHGKMEGVLKKHGITMQDYQRMMIAVQVDQEAQQKLMKMSGMGQQPATPASGK